MHVLYLLDAVVYQHDLQQLLVPRLLSQLPSKFMLPIAFQYEVHADNRVKTAGLFARDVHVIVLVVQDFFKYVGDVNLIRSLLELWITLGQTINVLPPIVDELVLFLWLILVAFNVLTKVVTSNLLVNDSTIHADIGGFTLFNLHLITALE